MALARAKGRADLSHSRRSYERGKGNGWRLRPFLVVGTVNYRRI